MKAIPQKPTIVFCMEIDAIAANKRLFNSDAQNKPTKGLWLLRESSVFGLLTVTYYDKESVVYRHQRIGFVDGAWTTGPKDKDEATEFARNATIAFSLLIPGNSPDDLLQFLENLGFDLANQLKPNALESSQTPQFSGYDQDALNRYAHMDEMPEKFEGVEEQGKGLDFDDGEVTGRYSPFCP